jgi:hypothetical protein
MLRLMGRKRWHLLIGWASFLSLAPSPAPPDPLQNVTSLRWIARQGYLEVLAEGGQVEYRFDHHLQLSRSRQVDPKAEREPAAADSVAQGLDQRLQIRGPGGRLVHWDPEQEILRMSPSSWEKTGSLEWGPDWARVEFRSARTLGPWLQWMDAKGQMHLVRVESSGSDPAQQIAYLRGLPSGQTIRLRHRPLDYRYPMRKWTEWVDLVVPEVDPAGLRPTSRLPE